MWPLAGRAQPAATTYRIGYLALLSLADEVIE
jgi:hypothetical protein